MVTCTYQLARAADAAPIAHMSQRFVETGLRPCWPSRRVMWHVRDRESIVLTAKSGETLLGFAIMRFGDYTSHLNLLAVLPQYRRCGIGRQLIDWLDESAITAGTFIVNLELRAGNCAARAFYSALGYVETGCIRGYYQGQDDAIQMTRDLGVNCSAAQRRQGA
jgi:ribosomal-protein-alanine N-acetyltransferase